VSCGVALLGVVCISFSPFGRRLGRDYAFAGAILAAERGPRRVPVRLVSSRARTLAMLGSPSTETIGRTFSAALAEARSDQSPDAQHAAGISYLLTGSPRDAVHFLDRAATSTNDPVFWSDLGAAQYVLALSENDDESLLSSLGSSEHALMLDRSRREAAYNFALAVEKLGITPAAAELWKEYGSYDDSDSGDAHARRLKLNQYRSDNAIWLDAVSREITDEALAMMALKYPQQARLWTEGDLLSRWAAAADIADETRAGHFLGQARTIATVLATRHGESMLRQTIAVIDGASAANDTVRLRRLIDAHVHYARGRQLYRANEIAGARREFERSENLLAMARSPFAAVAGAFVASAFHDADHLDEARDRLATLLATEDREHSEHVALRAQLRYEIARTDAVRGYWTDALTEATEAAELYRSIGETGNEGMTTSLIAEAYDFIGLPAASMRYGTDAIRLLAHTGDLYKLRVTTANLCRAAMRRAQWHSGRALIRIERSLERLRPDDLLSSDTSLRAAVIAQQLGDAAYAEHAMADAASKALRLRDAATRTSRMAEILATSAALRRRRDPSAAVAQLDKAIAYQERTKRAVFLPHLYLELGRAELSLHRPEQALADFEKGISHLEKQRSHIGEPSLRYGFFDDSHELFTSAIGLRVDRKSSDDVKAAFAILERGRARTLLEQIAGTPNASPITTDLTSVQRALPAGTLLLEYAVLPGRLLIFVAAAGRSELRQVQVDDRTVSATSSALIAALMSRSPRSDVEAAASAMHDLVLGAVPEYTKYERLVFVPDPKFQQVPFAALVNRRSGRYLIEDHLIVTSPSAAVFLQGRAAAAENTRPAAERAAVFVGTLADPGLGLRPLPNARHEADVVASCYRHPSTHDEVTSSIATFVNEALESAIVHFTGHALIDTADPAQSALVMSREDGKPALLRCTRIGTLGLHKTRIVVLAACSTMRGRAGLADGTPSIARSFLAAGAASVVGSLWDIDDADTSTLMADFHKGIAAGLPAAMALRNAQVKAIKSAYEPSRHAGSWSAFEVMGTGGL